MVSTLRVLHVTESHSQQAGGVTTVVNDLTENMINKGCYCCIIAATVKSERVPQDVDFIAMGEEFNKISAVFSSSLVKQIRDVIQNKKINVIHVHGVWMPMQLLAARVAVDMNIPFIVTSHGMLEPWLWRGKGWFHYLKKKLYFNVFSYPVFSKAKFIHAITPNEENNLRILFHENNIVVISNAIDGGGIKAYEGNLNEKSIFFIGRINPKKGIDILLHAYQKSGLFDLGWNLIVAGPEEVPEYAEELHKFIRQNDLGSRVKLIGAVYGEDKIKLYQHSWVTVVPSYSEVIGMVNLEASLYSCPTITTHQCGLWDWEKGGGMLIEPKVEALSSALQVSSNWSCEERRNRGLTSYELVQKNYTWEVVSKQWKTLYEEL